MYTITSLAKVLPAPISSKFYNNQTALLNEYREKGTLTLSSLVTVLGNPPIVPNTHDMDAMLEAWDEKAEYGRLSQLIEALLKNLI